VLRRGEGDRGHGRVGKIDDVRLGPLGMYPIEGVDEVLGRASARVRESAGMLVVRVELLCGERAVVALLAPKVDVHGNDHDAVAVGDFLRDVRA